MLRTTGPIRTTVKILSAFLCVIGLFGCGAEEKTISEKTQTPLNATVDERQQEDVFEPIFKKEEIPQDIREKMSGVTISEDSRMKFDSLSYLSLAYVGYDGKEYIGHMIVDKELADEVISIFEELYEIRFPIERMKLACEYGGDDELSMQDNNTSSFNDRPVTGGSGLSYHQLGRAIDINPFVNPYIRFSDNLVLPAGSGEYLDREKEAQGMIKKDSDCVEIFKKYGWTWGGDWKSLKDYQHFEKR